MDSNLQQQQQTNSGLMRYRSAPSSYFTSFMNSYGAGDLEQLLNPRASSPELERNFRTYMSGGGIEDSTSHNFSEVPQNYSSNTPVQSQFVASMKQEPEVYQHQQLQQQQQQEQQQQLQDDRYSSNSQINYRNQHQPNHTSVVLNTGVNESYQMMNSIQADPSPQMKMGMGGVSNSNLIRQSSSPAGLFSHINVEKDYGVIRGMGNFGAASSSSTNAETSFPPATVSRLKAVQLSSIPESGEKSMKDSNTSKTPFTEAALRNSGGFIPGFPLGSRDDSALLSDDFLQELEDDDGSTFSTPNKGNESGVRATTFLSHHLSLPKSTAELSGMDKLLQFQDSVPCKMRAKRGYATHPRSIAERVRRTRISERMRKLQDLVPNMDKQTNTADMLDLAVDYIKDLQREVKTLSDVRSKCTCSSKQKP